MRILKKPRTAWLTLNRSCNLRCKWCYAQDTEYCLNSDMKLDDAYKAIDIIKELGIKTAVLIGGEPSIYKDIFSVVSRCKEKGLRTVLVTNGVALSDMNLVKKLIASGLTSVNLSLKGSSNEDYLKETGVPAYDKAVAGVQNCAKAKLPFAVSYVVSNDNVNILYKTLKEFEKFSQGTQTYLLSFCGPYFEKGEIKDIGTKPVKLAHDFAKQCELLFKDNIKFNIHCTLPLCIFPKGFIKKMIEKNQISTMCHLQNRSGLIFDTNMNLLLCNALFDYPYATYGKDYHDTESLLKFLNSEETMSKFKQLLRVPDNKCVGCEDFSICAGGCVIQWFKYTFDDLMKERGEYKDE